MKIKGYKREQDAVAAFDLTWTMCDAVRTCYAHRMPDGSYVCVINAISSMRPVIAAGGKILMLDDACWEKQLANIFSQFKKEVV